jgi:hypothetical protein
MTSKGKEKNKPNKEILTKEDFFKALDKAILTIKKPKSPVKGKKKHRSNIFAVIVPESTLI